MGSLFVGVVVKAAPLAGLLLAVFGVAAASGLVVALQVDASRRTQAADPTQVAAVSVVGFIVGWVCATLVKLLILALLF